jgi:hypothetical protein
MYLFDYIKIILLSHRVNRIRKYIIENPLKWDNVGAKHFSQKSMLNQTNFNKNNVIDYCKGIEKNASPLQLWRYF